jgi:hypothetical protein
MESVKLFTKTTKEKRMSQININFDEVENEFKPIEPGVYEAVIEETPEVKQNKTNEGQSVHIITKITSEGPQNGKTIMGFISLKQQTALKRLALSAGLTPGAEGLDLNDLTGATVTIKVTHRTRKDPLTGEETVQANIADWVIPKEGSSSEAGVL